MSNKSRIIGDIEDGLNYHEFRKVYKELIANLTQADISRGYKLYKDKQDDLPIVINVTQTDIDKANSTYKKYSETSTKIGTNKLSDFVWSYYITNRNGNIELKDFDKDISNRIEMCYRDVLKNGGEMCKHMKIDFLSMRWKKSNKETIDVIRRRSNNDVNTVKEVVKVPSYREISPSHVKGNKKISINRYTPKKKTSTNKYTPKKKSCCN